MTSTDAAQQERERLLKQLPGLPALLVLDAASFGSIIAARPDVWDILRSFLARSMRRSYLDSVQAEATAMERERLRAILLAVHKKHDTGHYTLAYCPLCATAHHLLADPEVTE